MRSKAILTGIAILALSACGDSGSADADGDGSISPAELAESAAANDIKPQPGQYAMSMEVLEVSVPGAPAGVEDMMRQQMTQQSTEYCLTPEQAERGYEESARQAQQGSDCTFNRANFSGGKIDAEMVCNPPGQGSMTVTITGEGTATRSVMETTMRGNVAGAGEMSIRTRTTQERIGDCPS